MTVCLTCLAPIPAATDPLDRDNVPSDGAISICLYCGAIAIFTGRQDVDTKGRPVYELRDATSEELLDALSDPVVRKYRKARAEVMGRRYP